MGAVAKLSVSLPITVHEWAVTHAEEAGLSLSALITEALMERQRRVRQQIALREALYHILDKPLTGAELDAAEAELLKVCAD